MSPCTKRNQRTSSAVAASRLLEVGVTAMPIAIGVGILKYRLYDIDRIISRTLAYAIVTGLLVGVYAGLVLLATQVLTIKSPVAVAVSTLAAAALFSPLRRRVQRAVDRRFNRSRYNADQTVAAFAVRLKDAVDLDAVQHDLSSIVHQALEPAHVSVSLGKFTLRNYLPVTANLRCPRSPAPTAPRRVLLRRRRGTPSGDSSTAGTAWPGRCR